MKPLSKFIFAGYLLVLLWLVLFKFSYDIVAVIETLHVRVLNLIPFNGNSRREMLENMLVFIPFGLLLSVNFKRTLSWRKLAIICIFSCTVEVIQYVLAIGRTDITDVITNTFGGLVGLALYEFGKKYIDNQKLDRVVVVVTAILLTAVILLRTLVLRIKY